MDKYIIKITNHSTSCQQENKQVEFELISPVEVNMQVISCLQLVYVMSM